MSWTLDWETRLSHAVQPPLRTVFCGAPAFALPALEYSFHGGDGKLALAGVLSQPDRRAGRGRRRTPPPVAARAAELGVPLKQPDRLDDSRPWLEAFAPDLLLVEAYGKILPTWLLELPRIAPLNLHASLLPRHRGAAPIQAALLAGDRETGITLMGMEPGLDTGPILHQKRIAITPKTTAVDLHDQLSRLAVETLDEGLEQLMAGQLMARPQTEAQATYAGKLSKADAWIDWRASAEQIDRQVRALQPWPGTKAVWNDTVLKVIDGMPLSDATSDAVPGSVLAAGPEGIDVATGGGQYRILRVQPPGKRAMATADFLRGNPVALGDRFGGP